MRVSGLVLVLALSIFLAACSKKDEQTSSPQSTVTAPAASQTAATGATATPQQAQPQQAPAGTAAPNPYVPAEPNPIQTQPSGVLIVSSNFACKDGSSFIVEFRSQPRHAEILLDKQRRLVLPQADAATGFSYRTSQYQLRGAGRQVTWTVTGKQPLTCESKI